MSSSTRSGSSSAGVAALMSYNRRIVFAFVSDWQMARIRLTAPVEFQSDAGRDQSTDSAPQSPMRIGWLTCAG